MIRGLPIPNLNQHLPVTAVSIFGPTPLDDPSHTQTPALVSPHMRQADRRLHWDEYGYDRRSPSAFPVKNRRLERSTVDDPDMPPVPDRDRLSVRQRTEGSADGLERDSNIGADVGAFHRQIYFRRASSLLRLLRFEHLQEKSDPRYRAMPAEEQ